MAKIFIGVGSNVNPRSNIDKALVALTEFCDAIEESPCYLSPGENGATGIFANLVISAETDLSPFNLVRKLKSIERDCGRTAAQQTIDLDLLIYDELSLAEGDVNVPRDDIVRFAFVLKPLSDLAPQVTHPTLGLRFSELWHASNFSAENLTQIARNALP